MNIEKYIQDISELEDAESPEGRTNRFGLMMDTILENVEGNIIEDGAGFGHSTKVFLKSAKSFGRKVMVFDPFLDPVYPYEQFLDNVKGYEDELIIYKQPSSVRFHEPKILPLAFVFMDGLQTKDIVLQDLLFFADVRTKIICVDDINRETPTSQVPAAVEEFLKLGTYRMVKTRKLIECYLIKNG